MYALLYRNQNKKQFFIFLLFSKQILRLIRKTIEDKNNKNPLFY